MLQKERRYLGKFWIRNIMAINEFHFFFSIFKILFIAQKENKFDQEWVILKRKSDNLINEICISYLAKLIKLKMVHDADQAQKDLILLSSILRKQFQIRTLVAKNFYFLKSVQLKCIIAIIYLYIRLIKKYLNQIFSLPYEFHASKDMVGKKINFIIGFPQHSFNFKKKQTCFPSSFAEFILFNRPSVDEHEIFISLDEYRRKSKKIEDRSKYPDPEISRLEVIGTNKIFSIKNFFVKIKNLPLFYIKYRPWTLALYLEECSQKMQINSHLVFIENLKKNNQILEVYFLPFSDYLMLQFCKELEGKSNVYYYSDNMLIPPTCFFNNALVQKKINKFVDGNYSSFYGIKRTSGFVSVNNFLNIIAHVNFLNREKNEVFTANEMPSMLGFESLLKIKELNGVYVVSVFDVPPESTFQQLSRSTSGDKTSDIQFVSDFLNDLINESLDSDIIFLYKPKYSLSNYSDDYRSIITSLKKSLGEKFIVLDPYVRIGDIIERSDLVVSFPYTSTKRFAEFYGKKSFYYIPSKYGEIFRAYSSGYGSETIYGKNELIKFINNHKLERIYEKCWG